MPPTPAHRLHVGPPPNFHRHTEFDAFDIGWRPHLPTELPLLEHWVVREADGADFFVLIGRRAGHLYQAPVLCVDPAAGLARFWDEWLTLGCAAPAIKLPALKQVTAAGRDWVLACLRGAAA